jgi:hypothetical protein
MLNGKYVSSFEVIRNVIRDTELTKVKWQDALEWCATALDLIGVPHYLKNNIACIEIENYRGTLPCDFQQMTQASGLSGCRQFPMRETTDSFHPIFTCTTDTNNTTGCNGPFAAGSNLIDTNTPIGQDANGNPTFNFMNDTNVTLPQAIAGGSGTVHCPDDATYRLNDNFIFTSFKEGRVLIAYKALPIDENGFPLVPDDEKFKLALQWYVTMKLDYILWRQGDITDKVFNYSEQQWAWYCGGAGNRAKIPSIDKMESWKNQMLHLIPRINQHSKFFSDLGSREKLLFGRKY